MSKEVAGIKLKELELHIRSAVRDYQRLGNGTLVFDPDRAAELQLTPEKPNSARSKTEVRDHRGDYVGDLYTIAFKPEDGTGDEGTFKVHDLDFDPEYPQEAKTVPRSKSATHTEIYLPILSQRIDRHFSPTPFGGTLDLLGLDKSHKRPKVIKLGELGYQGWADPRKPQAVYTTGWRKNLGKPFKERFGDPHAVFNSLPDTLVIAAFLAVTNDTLLRANSTALTSLESIRPREPRWIDRV